MIPARMSTALHLKLETKLWNQHSLAARHGWEVARSQSGTNLQNMGTTNWLNAMEMDLLSRMFPKEKNGGPAEASPPPEEESESS